MRLPGQAGPAVRISCPCGRCAHLAPATRIVSRDLARKHLKRYGPAALHPQPIGNEPEARAVQHPAEGHISEYLLHFLCPEYERSFTDDIDHDLDDFHDGGQWDDVQQHDEIQPIVDAPAARDNGRVTPSDTTYTTVEVPGLPRDDLPVHPEDDRPLFPPAYRDNEPSWVRIAYLQAVLNNVAGNMSVKQTTQNLNSTLNALNAAGVLPDRPRPVRTLASAKKRLGIDPDVWISQYAICPYCWKHYSPKQVIEMESPQCHSPACNGTVYEVTTDDKGRLKRRPIKIIPHVSLIDSLRRIVRRKGFRKLVRDSRQTPVRPNDDEEFVMTDMHDAAIWHDLKTGIKREVGNYGNVRDSPVGVDTERKLTDFRFGLHLVVNLDWYVESAWRFDSGLTT